MKNFAPQALVGAAFSAIALSAAAAPSVPLRALVLVDDRSALHREGVQGVSGIDATHAPELPATEADRVLKPLASSCRRRRSMAAWSRCW
jgi:hypothetical protein